ncbi:hypothetical protein Tco_0885380 [Tanacetum coccineum]
MTSPKANCDPTLFIRRDGENNLLPGTNLCREILSLLHLHKLNFISHQNPRGIFINQSKYALESLKKSKLDEDKEWKAVDPSHYRVCPIADQAGCQIHAKSAAISSIEAEYMLCPLVVWLKSLDEIHSLPTKALIQ